MQLIGERPADAHAVVREARAVLFEVERLRSGKLLLMADINGRRGPARKVLAYSAVLVGTLLTAALTVIGTGLGSWFLGLFDSEQGLVSSSATEEVYECGTHLFVKKAEARRIVSGAVRTEDEWTSFYRTHNAIVVGDSEVLVSIQGESSRPITLTGIDFNVRRRQRPAGVVFALPCGGPGTGRFLKFDMDRRPARIVASAQDPKATTGFSGYRPIRFPWIVSISDPLLLRIVAVTKRCYCTWRAFLSWRSGSKSGQIAVDNDGKGYAVVGAYGLRHYGLAAKNKWVVSVGPR